MIVKKFTNKLKILLKYGLIKIKEKGRHPFLKEKKYSLTEIGKILADAFAEILS